MGAENWDFEPSAPVEIGNGPKFLDQPFFSVYHDTIMNIIYVSVILIVIAWLIRRRVGKSPYPGRIQLMAELFVDTFDSLCQQVLGRISGRKFLPFIGTLFLFVWGSNMIGLLKIDALTGGLLFNGPKSMWFVGGDKITEDVNGDGLYEPYLGDTADPGKDGVYDSGFPIPAFSEPTRNINVPLGLAILFLTITTIVQVRRHGLLSPITELFEPIFLMFPLNAVGKVAEVASISFRLFGNIFGGAVIIVVVGNLLHNILVPIGLDFFFGIFVGTVQAFVFTMLSLTYLAMSIGSDDDQEAAAENG